MKYKIIYIFLIFCISKIIYSGTNWQFSAGVNGNGGLMIVYKTLPPLVVNVDQPKVMRVKKGRDPFKYSESSGENKPLNVMIKVEFNKEVVGENGINKEIIRSIYNNVTLSFKNNGIFSLIKTTEKSDLQIDAQAYFTDQNGIRINDKAHPIINRNLSDTIQNGILLQNDIYIDAEFNKMQQELLEGRYEGTVILEVEFNGKNL